MKQLIPRDVRSGFKSLPTRERELKQIIRNLEKESAQSLPTRERELKLGAGRGLLPRPEVAPYTGA